MISRIISLVISIRSFIFNFFFNYFKNDREVYIHNCLLENLNELKNQKLLIIQEKKKIEFENKIKPIFENQITKLNVFYDNLNQEKDNLLKKLEKNKIEYDEIGIENKKLYLKIKELMKKKNLEEIEYKKKILKTQMISRKPENELKNIKLNINIIDEKIKFLKKLFDSLSIEQELSEKMEEEIELRENLRKWKSFGKTEEFKKGIKTIEDILKELFRSRRVYLNKIGENFRKFLLENADF